MHFEKYSFGSIRIDDVTYEHDVVIDHGQVRNDRNNASKKLRYSLRAHAVVHRRGNTVEMPAAGDRHRNRRVAGDG
jgi:hypothetical protein